MLRALFSSVHVPVEGSLPLLDEGGFDKGLHCIGQFQLHLDKLHIYMYLGYSPYVYYSDSEIDCELFPVSYRVS